MESKSKNLFFTALPRAGDTWEVVDPVPQSSRPVLRARCDQSLGANYCTQTLGVFNLPVDNTPRTFDCGHTRRSSP